MNKTKTDSNNLEKLKKLQKMLVISGAIVLMGYYYVFYLYRGTYNYNHFYFWFSWLYLLSIIPINYVISSKIKKLKGWE